MEEENTSVESTEKENAFDSTEKVDERSEGRDKTDIRDNIETEAPKDFSSNLDLSFIQKEVENDPILAKPTLADFQKAAETMAESDEEKKRKEAAKFDEEMKKNLSDPELVKAAKEQQELEKNTPGTKEYKRNELNKTASEAAIASNTATSEIGGEAVKSYLQSATTQALAGVLGPMAGGALAHIPGVGGALQGLASAIAPGGGAAPIDLLMNVMGNSAANVGGAIATGAMAAGGKAAEGKAGWGVQVTPDMWTNAIDNVGLGNTKLGQLLKDKLNGIKDSPITDEEVAQEIENNPEVAEQFQKVIEDITEHIKTEKPEDKSGESKETTETPDTPEDVKATVDSVDVEDVASEVEKEVDLGDKETSDHVRETINNAIDRLKDSDNFKQWWDEVSSLVPRVKQAIADGDHETAMKWYWKIADFIIPGYSKVVAGTTIAAVLIERLLGIKLTDVPNNHGSREDENLYTNDNPTDLSTRRDSKFIGEQNQTNEWNRGIQKDVYSDEQVKGFVRTMVRGQPHVRNLANKLRNK